MIFSVFFHFIFSIDHETNEEPSQEKERKSQYNEHTHYTFRTWIQSVFIDLSRSLDDDDDDEKHTPKIRWSVKLICIHWYKCVNGLVGLHVWHGPSIPHNNDQSSLVIPLSTFDDEMHMNAERPSGWMQWMLRSDRAAENWFAIRWYAY